MSALWNPMPEMTGDVFLGVGRLADARAQFWRDAEVAEANGDADGLAVAALGLGGIWVHEHRSTLEQAWVESLQRHALAGLDPDSSLAHRIDVRLTAEEAYLVGDPTPVLDVLERARTAGDPIVLAEALSLAHHCVLGPHHASLRLALADELIAVSPGTGRLLDGLMGLAWRMVDLFLMGDRRALRALAELRERLEVDRCDGLRYLVSSVEVMLAVRDGRLDDAEELAGECYELGLDVGDADALGWYGAQLVAIRWLQGRSAELLPVVQEIANSTTIAEPGAGFLAAVAALAATSGDRPAAQAALACLRAEGLRTLASSSSWSATMLGVCEAAHAVGDAEAAADAYVLLAPFADFPVMASIGIASYGSAHRPLALAAWTMGDLDRAVIHLEAAAAAELATGDQPWHAISLATLADVLDQRGGTGDTERAGDLRRAAVAAARRLGMQRRADQWESRSVSRSVVCRRDGRMWTIRFGEHVAVVPHSVGMEYLAELFMRPGVEIAAVALASGHALACRGTPGEPLLDARATAEYRRRIEELDGEIDDADACADIERAARARAELDRLVEELVQTTALAGTSRAFTDDAERARVSVHKAIKRALRVITDADPSLGHELSSRVVTGMRCVYRTEPRVDANEIAPFHTVPYRVTAVSRLPAGVNDDTTERRAPMRIRQASVGLGVFAALTAGIIAPALVSQPAEAIVGGVEVPTWIYPQYVRVLNNVTCGGTVIAADTVLTAAHCVDGGVTAAQTSVLVSDVFPRSVTNITIHPLWNGDLTDAHDLAILSLTAGATAGVNPIQVGSPWNGSYYAANTPSTIVGHGATHGGGSATSELRAVDTVLRSDGYMDDIYNPWYWFDDWNESLLIGAGSLDHTVCNGDSGGPLVVDKDGTWNWIQVGVASFVQEWPTNCRQPGGFTELRNAQLAWIAQTVPAVMAKWGTCYTPSGFVGQSSARYVGWFLPGGQRDGNFYWEIACYGIPNPPPPPPPPGPGDPPPTEDPPPHARRRSQGAGDSSGGHVRRDSSSGLISPTSLPSGSATIA